TPTLTCKDLTLTFTGSSSSAQVPHCSYVYPGGTIANPCPKQRAPHDFNGDGISDILLETSSTAVGMWLMNSSPAIGSPRNVGTVGSGWSLAGQRDFNGDGFADLLLRYTDGSLVAYLMNGATIASTVNLHNPGTIWNVVGPGDFNGDGFGDILLRGDGTA